MMLLFVPTACSMSTACPRAPPWGGGEHPTLEPRLNQIFVPLLSVIDAPRDFYIVPQDSSATRLRPQDVDRLAAEDARLQEYLKNLASTFGDARVSTEVTNELLEDSAFNLASELAQDFATEFARLEGASPVEAVAASVPEVSEEARGATDGLRARHARRARWPGL
jgi:hypothetical protein